MSAHLARDKAGKTSKAVDKHHKRNKNTGVEVVSPVDDTYAAGQVPLGTTDTDQKKEESKKRKREDKPEDELEIDVNLPEPPSKKALRKAKKVKSKPEKSAALQTDAVQNDANVVPKAKSTVKTTADKLAKPSPANGVNPAVRSEHGIWIGNLPWNANKDTLQVFLIEKVNLQASDITRIHLPAPDRVDPKRALKPANRGFAYVDFTTPNAVQKAIAASETLFGGRPVLIKDAKSFAGRPEKPATATTDGVKSAVNGSAKAPAKRIFVGNLGFDVTKETLEEHFGQAGEVENIHMATFEDSGKCKGFAWITFAELEAAQAAVRGFVFKENPDYIRSSDEDEEDDLDAIIKARKAKKAPKKDDGDSTSADSSSSDDNNPSSKKRNPAPKSKAKKQRKWFINRLFGRALRCEFAEDPSTRYKKRFTSQAGERGGAAAAKSAEDAGAEDAGPRSAEQHRTDRHAKRDVERAERWQRRVDARSIAPGAALAYAPRASGAIVEAKGKKTTFE
ncbi:Nucleolar protein 13 [Elasticomyces elasticus]|nr:Nucleolar protein 13 [Elasticomyces elasticus]